MTHLEVTGVGAVQSALEKNRFAGKEVFSEVCLGEHKTPNVRCLHDAFWQL